jgi:hypothetical protein
VEAREEDEDEEEDEEDLSAGETLAAGEDKGLGLPTDDDDETACSVGCPPFPLGPSACSLILGYQLTTVSSEPSRP